MKNTLCWLWPVLVSCLLLTGCTTTITNLTPSTQKRNADSVYPFEVALDIRNRGIRQETIQPYVVIGSQVYPMQPTMMLKNRWETLVPIPPDREFVSYRYKFDYDYNSIPRPQSSSKLSPPYQLQVLDK